jgi:hypothetical protein
MRCNNCGWNNADDAVSCVKCNNALVEEPVQRSVSPQGRGTKSMQPAGGAAAEGQPNLVACPHCSYPTSRVVQDCPSCGGPMTSAKAWSGPGPSQQEKGQAEGGGQAQGGAKDEQAQGGAQEKGQMDGARQGGGKLEGTVDPYRPGQPGGNGQPTQPEFYLEKLGQSGEKTPVLRLKTDAEDQAPVSRSVLDENNFTITSKVQAVFAFKDNKWWLVDRSELKTTFIQAREPRELKDGDVILMGDRKFVFYSSDPGRPGNPTT